MNEMLTKSVHFIALHIPHKILNNGFKKIHIDILISHNDYNVFFRWFLRHSQNSGKI